MAVPPDLAENAGRIEKAWEPRSNEPIIFFQRTEDKHWFGVPMFQQLMVRCIPERKAILFMFQRINVVVVGNDMETLRIAYAGHRAQDIKADGKRIERIFTIPADEAQAMAQ